MKFEHLKITSTLIAPVWRIVIIYFNCRMELCRSAVCTSVAKGAESIFFGNLKTDGHNKHKIGRINLIG